MLIPDHVLLKRQNYLIRAELKVETPQVSEQEDPVCISMDMSGSDMPMDKTCDENEHDVMNRLQQSANVAFNNQLSAVSEKELMKRNNTNIT